MLGGMVAFIPLPPVAATEYPPAQEPMSSQERLERTVSLADAICLALPYGRRLVAKEGFDRVGVLIRPTEVFMGTLPADTLFVYLPGTEPPFSDPPVDLSRKPVHAQLYVLGRSSDSWFIIDNDDPYTFNFGKLLLQPSGADSIRRLIQRTRDRQSLDSLVARSGIVLVGSMSGGSVVCRVGDAERGCVAVHVEQLLAGEGVPDTIQVYSALSDLVRRGQSLLFLERVGPNVFTPVSAHAGAVVNRAGYAGRTERRFEDLVREVDTMLRRDRRPSPLASPSRPSPG
jgi:hypothetical protein